MLYPKNLYEEITYKPKFDIRWLIGPVLWCIVPSLFLGLFQMLKGNREVMNFAVNRLTTPLKHLLSRLNALFPFAVAEVLWVLAAIIALIFLARTIWLLISREGKLRRLIRRILAALAAALIVYCGYTLMWGINYYSDSFSERSGLTARGCSTEELYQLTASFAAKCGELSSQIPRDGESVANFDYVSLFQDVSALYTGVIQEFPYLEQPIFDPKPMFFSRLISYTGFTGFYFPMTAESLINVDQPDCLIPSTVLHELAHQCNVSGEDECNFIAILAGLRCDDPIYQYSSALLGYIHLSNALYSADQALWQEAAGYLNEETLADLSANNAYWKQFKTPVEETSKKIYTGFLESYDQTEGLKSYGQCVDLLVAYYFDYR